MFIRKYQPSDLPELLALYSDTIRLINAKDYTKAQRDAWIGQIDKEKWNRSLQEHHSIVMIDNQTIAGFGDIDKTGYLDRLFVHAHYQRKGIATAICDNLEQSVKGNKLTTHASVTARLFFEKRGYKVIREQKIIRNGICLTNYLMEKKR